MRLSLLVLPCLLSSATAFAQAPANKQHCSITPAVALTDADKAYIAGDLAGAEGLYTTSLASTPAIAYAGVVRSQLQQNKLAEALKSAQAALAALPASALATSLLGDVYLRSGEMPEAFETYRKALDLDQCSPRAHLGWGRVNGMLSRHATEAHELAAAHALAPYDAEVTAAWIADLAPAQRATPLEKLLASTPLLPPDKVARLATELAIDQQGKFCTAVESPDNVKFDLQPVMFRGKYTRDWGLKLTVNADSLALVELDSSVSGIVLNPKDAQKTNVHAIGPAPTSSFAPYTAIADTIRIGNIEYRGCPVRVAANEDTVANSHSLIGLDFFRDHLIHLDYVAQTLSLSPLPERPQATAGTPSDTFIPADEKIWSPVYISGSTLLLPTGINKKGQYLFLLNTAMNPTILSPAILQSVLQASTDKTANAEGESGEIVRVLPKEGGVNEDRTDVVGPDGKLLKVSRPVKAPTFRFGHTELTETATLSFDMNTLSHVKEIEITGLLGFRILSQFYLDFNYRDGLVHLNYDQNRKYAVRQADKEYLGNYF